MSKFIALLPCAGSGSRFGSVLAKQYHSLCNKTVLDWTLSAFETVAEIGEVLLVASPADELIDKYATKYNKVKIAKVGGTTRAESVSNGLRALELMPDDWVLVHDAARCCVHPDDIRKLINQLKNGTNGGILASKAVDTIKQADAAKQVLTTLDRQYIYMAQTPQMFRYQELTHALSRVDLAQVTDEASAIELAGGVVKIIESSAPNLKVTFPFDLQIAELVINSYLQDSIYV
ncbi:MAG: 2-C-methyl-D-erythritol 4-phosphate cytidylyltransferase [Burkholderiales bacterium]|nr:2-C-methyl-D-erythritol 4-phosphate cytidylyltransferase [Burkholderiales bacterium]